MADDESAAAASDPTFARRTARGLVELVWRVYGVSVETQISFLAAAIAYYAFVSLVPLVVLAVVVATSIGGEALANQVVTLAADVLAPTAQEQLRLAVTVRTGVGGVTIISVIVLVWGALKAFRALDRAFSLVYGTRSPPSLARSVVDAAVALLAVGIGGFAMLIAGTAVTILEGPLVGPVGTVVLVATLAVVFLPLYYLFPDPQVTVVEVVPGAVVAAIGWTLLGGAFQLYAAVFGSASIYGLLGGVLLALTWLYFGALVLLLSAAVNAVRSGHAGPPDR